MMSEHGMCTPTDPRFHKKREDFRYVYKCQTVLYTNYVKKCAPRHRARSTSRLPHAASRVLDAMSTSRPIARASPLASHPSSRPRRAHSRARIPRARAGGDESRPPARAADDAAARARPPAPAWAPAATNRRDPRATTTTPRAGARRHDRGPRRMIRDTPVSPVLDSRARRERRRRARWTRGRFGGRRRGTRVDARASTNAREREIRTSIGAWTMI